MRTIRCPRCGNFHTIGQNSADLICPTCRDREYQETLSHRVVPRKPGLYFLSAPVGWVRINNDDNQDEVNNVEI